MTTEDALLLSHAIPDELRNAGRDDLADDAVRLGERLAEAEREIEALERLERNTREQSRFIIQLEREIGRGRESAYARQCEIRGPWRHVAIDEAYRGSPGVRISCDYCQRDQPPVLAALDGPPSPIRPGRHSIVNMMNQRFAPGASRGPLGDEPGVSPAIHVGRCEVCGTWYVG